MRGGSRAQLLFWGSLTHQIAGSGQVETMPAAEKKKLVDTDGELGLTMDPSLLRGATADLLIKNRSEIFSSNVLSQKDLAQLHESTAIVSFLHARRPRPTPSTCPRHLPLAVHAGQKSAQEGEKEKEKGEEAPEARVRRVVERGVRRRGLRAARWHRVAAATTTRC